MNPFLSRKPLLWSRDPRGLAIVFSNSRELERARNGRGPEALQLAWIRMRLLMEQGNAESVPDSGESRGIFLQTEGAVALDDDTRELFQLPHKWDGSFRLELRGVPHTSDFSACVLLKSASGIEIRQWSLTGPVLEVGDTFYLPLPEQYAVLRAIVDWTGLPTAQRNEYENLLLLARLNAAHEAGCKIELDAFRDTKVSEAEEMEVQASDDPSGAIVLSPRIADARGAFSPKQIAERIHQLGGDESRAVVRVKQRIVLLDEAQTRRARQILRNPRVPVEERTAFLHNPSAWLAENVFSDTETEFCPRVTGLEVWNPRYFGAASESGIEWFEKKPPSEPVEKSQIEKSKGSGDGQGGELEQDDLTDEDGQIVLGIHDNDLVLNYGGTTDPHPAGSAEKVDIHRYKRQPLPHQIEAIEWLLGHARRVFPSGKALDKGDPGGGVLLADDMGLGKTFSTLVFLGEWMRWLRERDCNEPEAVLVVAPVTLLENWREEIAKTYPAEMSVFKRVAFAYPEGELSRFKTKAGYDVPDTGGHDPKQRMKALGLVRGTGNSDSIDCPGTLVFTTYATLRNFRFSFGACRWSVAIFDEAQNLKNPNALQTIAAKALNARYRILATGTPVENHLGDFWSLLDLAEPGFLDSFQNFRKTYITPVLADRSLVFSTGRALREKTGELMLRRLKEKTIVGLPTKTIILHEPGNANGYDRRIVATMTGRQRELYDQVLEKARGEQDDSATEKQRQNRWLSALWQLREVTLHPSLFGGEKIPLGARARECETTLRESAKLGRVLDIVDRVKRSREKVLIFAINKRLQEGIAASLCKIYGFEIPIINGDAPTGTRSQLPEAMNRTRFGMIEAFQKADGFGICILSPLAAGVGLTITAANHVIHLERHWNPAKEAQATDRVYRIGQKRDVFVHVPILIHPERASFDVNLDQLLRSKMTMQDALTIAVPDEVSQAEVLGKMFGESATREVTRAPEIVEL